MITDWDLFFMNLAKVYARKSKDPSTQCGAVIVRPDNTVAALGYNGFPRSIEDTPALLLVREEKYARMVHSEMNAVLTAKEPLQGYTLYNWPLIPCERCAVHIIQSGITRIVTPRCPETHIERWGDSFDKSMSLFEEAGIQVDFAPQPNEVEVQSYAELAGNGTEVEAWQERAYDAEDRLTVAEQLIIDLDLQGGTEEWPEGIRNRIDDLVGTSHRTVN